VPGSRPVAPPQFEISIGEPVKHGEGVSAFVTYPVHTRTRCGRGRQADTVYLVRAGVTSLAKWFSSWEGERERTESVG
jgi:hypothetical protein